MTMTITDWITPPSPPLPESKIHWARPPVYHRHTWRVHVRADALLHVNPTADEIDDSIYGVCEDCGATMERAGIESVLNGERFLTDE